MLDDRVVAYLSEPRFEDMFWISYRVTPLTDEPELAARLSEPEFWRSAEPDGFGYRSRALGLFAPLARPSIGEHEPGRVTMRGLYITPEMLARSGQPSPADTLEEPMASWWVRAWRWLRRLVRGGG